MQHISAKLVPWLFILTSRCSDVLWPLKMWLWPTTTTTLAPQTWPHCNFFSFLRMKLQLTQCCCQDVSRIQDQSPTVLTYDTKKPVPQVSVAVAETVDMLYCFRKILGIPLLEKFPNIFQKAVTNFTCYEICGDNVLSEADKIKRTVQTSIHIIGKILTQLPKQKRHLIYTE